MSDEVELNNGFTLKHEIVNLGRNGHPYRVWAIYDPEGLKRGSARRRDDAEMLADYHASKRTL